MTKNRIADRAVVLGGSIAGLLAARVLSESYQEVVVVERDELPVGAAQRRGVPQGRHIHGLGGRGQQILEELFPELTADLVAQGAPVVDQLNDARLYLSGHRLRQAASGVRVLSASRPCLEGYLRGRVRSLPGVTFADRCDALGFTTTPDGGTVTGVRVIRRADGSAEESLDADLVVDTTGRGSRTPRWLDALGYGCPAQDTVAADIAYATVILRLRPDALGSDLAVIAPPKPGHHRGGGLAAIEGDRHILTLMGILGDRPPTTPEGFLEYARSLQVPDIYDAVHDAEMLTDPVATRFPASVRHRCERMSRFPRGLLVMGDALCSFNPIYGQGISVAAIEALTLRQHLQGDRVRDTHKIIRALTKAIDAPWDLASGGDLAFPAVEGERNTKVRIGNAYIPRLHAAAASNAKLGTAFVRVAAMLDPPQRLFRPAIIVRVLAHALRNRRDSAPTEQSANELLRS